MKVCNTGRLRLTAAFAGAVLCLLAAGCTSGPSQPGRPAGGRLQRSAESRWVGLAQRVAHRGTDR